MSPRKVTTKNISQGSIMWFECKEKNLLSTVQKSLDNNGFSHLSIEQRTSWFSFRQSWKRFSNALRNCKAGWLTRLVTGVNTKELVAIVREDKDVEQLNFKHDFALLMEGLSDHEQLQMKCACGATYNVNMIAGNRCPSCYCELPPIVADIIEDYQEDQNYCQPDNRGQFIRNFMKASGVISLASTGRPFYHPALEGSELERFFQAVTEWGDRVVVIPLAPNTEMPRLAFEALTDELKVLHSDSATWSDTTRERTRTVRLEALEAIRSKLNLYTNILGEFKAQAEIYAEEVKVAMLSVILGKDKENMKKEAKEDICSE